jgi:hypothetical protein
MDQVQKVKVFFKELLVIKDKNIRNFTSQVIANLPNYFFQIPASSTGKYHPPYSLTEGGLVKHVKACVRVAHSLFRNHTIREFTEHEQDIIVCSLLLHDGLKNGGNYKPHTNPNHPNIVAYFVHTHEQFTSLISPDDLKIIIGCLRTHSGIFNKEWRTGKEILPIPSNDYENFVHLCDYITSRKYIDINLDEPIEAWEL